MGYIINKTIKTTIINYIGFVLGAVNMLLLQPLIFDLSQIGEFRLILDKAYILIPILIFSLNSLIIKFYFKFEQSDHDLSKFISLLITIPLFNIILGVAAYNIFNYHVDHVALISLIIASNIFIQIIENLLIVKGDILLASFLKNISLRICTIISLGLVYFGFIDFEIFILINSLIFIVHLFIIGFYYFNKFPMTFKFTFSFLNEPHFKEMMKYCIFLLLASGTTAIVTRIDNVMIGSVLKTDSFVGVYTIALSITAFIELPRRPLNQLLAPIISKELYSNNLNKVEELYKKSSINLFIITGFIYLLLVDNIDFIINIIPKNETLIDAKEVIYILGLTKLIDMTSGMNGEIIHYSKYYKINTIIMPLFTIVIILCNSFLIPKYLILGAAYGTLFGFIFINITRIIYVYLKFKIIPFSKNHLKILGLFTLSFLVTYNYSLDNIYLNLISSVLVVTTLFLVPIYVKKYSLELNTIINSIPKYLKLKK